MAVRLWAIDTAILAWLLHEAPVPAACAALIAPSDPLEEPAILRWLFGAALRFSAATGRSGLFMILDDRTIVGLCSFKGPPIEGRVEIGYGILTLHRNRGYATAAVGLLLDEAALIPLLTTVTAQTEQDNVASAKVLVHHGFHRPAARTGDDGPLFLWERPLAQKD